MIVHVSAQVVVTETYDDVASPEEAVLRFVTDRGFKSIEDAATYEGLTADEYYQSLMIEEYRPRP
jgi:hypothetical protein